MIFARQTIQKCLRFNQNVLIRSVSYEQGQKYDNKIREYFYYIDHNGMVRKVDHPMFHCNFHWPDLVRQLFLDDAKMKNFTSCFKDKKFLQFFFHRLRINETGRYQDDFPYLSVCGRERNYIRCDDLPIVFTHVLTAADGKAPSER